MKYLKSHISVILTLFILLFSVQFSIEMYRIIQKQNQNLIKNYSIVVVSKSKLNVKSLRKLVKDIDSVSSISPKKIIDKLKNSMSSKNLKILEATLPHFYSVKLKSLQDKDRLNSIKKSLLSLKEILRVEIFTKTYDSMYQILQILQFITYAFNGIIFFMSILLLFKQIRIWILEHEDKIKIMGYFGASYWIKSAFLYKLVLIDSLISTSLVWLLFLYIVKSEYVKDKLSVISVSFPETAMVYDMGILFVVAISLSLSIVTIVSRKMSS